MTGTEVATVQSHGSLAVRADQGDWTDEQRAALAQIGVAEAPRADQLVFLHVSQRMGLDPFNREIYLIGRWDSELGRKKWTIQVGIDGFRSKSEEHPEYSGVDDAEWCGSDGVWRDVWLAEEPPIAARFTVYRKDWERPARAVAHYREYVQTKKDGKPTSMWASKPAGQLAKCAEALARRKAFPRRLGGVYIAEELQHLDNPQPPPVVIAEAERVEPAEPDWDALIAEGEAARDVAKLGETWKLARGLRPNDAALLDRIAAAGERVKATIASADAATQPPTKTQMNRLSKLLAEGGVTSDEGRDRLAAHVLEHDEVTVKTLTANAVSQLTARLEQLKAEGRLGAQPAEPETPADRQQPTDTEAGQP